MTDPRILGQAELHLRQLSTLRQSMQRAAEVFEWVMLAQYGRGTSQAKRRLELEEKLWPTDSPAD